MNLVTAILEIEQKGELLILKPVKELHDLDELEIEEAKYELSERMGHSGVSDVYLDLHGVDVLGSHAPLLAMELLKKVRTNGGSMAIGLI
jgi:anti-anti-sigma regulatory factor